MDSEERNPVSGGVWVMRIAFGVLLGNVIFALITFVLFRAVVTGAFDTKPAYDTTYQSNKSAEELADDIERQADNLEAMADNLMATQ